MSAPTTTGDVADPVTAMLQQAKAASGGRLLALHTDLAVSPAALAAYLGLPERAASTGRWIRPFAPPSC